MPRLRRCWLAWTLLAAVGCDPDPVENEGDSAAGSDGSSTSTTSRPSWESSSTTGPDRETGHVDDDTATTGGVADTDATDGSGDAVSFAELARVIDASCGSSGCHVTATSTNASPSRVYLETPGDVAIAIYTAELIEWVRDGTMPAGGRSIQGATRAEFVAMLEAWEDAGYPP